MHAFDVQPAAIEAARAAVRAAVPAERAPEVHFHLASHAEMRERLGCTACATLVVFNLGERGVGGRHRGLQEAHTSMPVCVLPSSWTVCRAQLGLSLRLACLHSLDAPGRILAVCWLQATCPAATRAPPRRQTARSRRCRRPATSSSLAAC